MARSREGLARGFMPLDGDPYHDPNAPPSPPDGLADSLVVISDDPSIAPRIDPETGAVSIDTEDGGVVVHLTPPRPEDDESDGEFYENLAEKIDPEIRARIVDEVLRGIEADEESRRDWLEMRAEGIAMLGTTLEKPTSDVGNSMGAAEGMSRIRHPLLMEAIARFQANAGGELYPPTGPVKVRDDRPSRPAGVTPPAISSDPLFFDETVADQAAIDSASRDEVAEALEKGFNHNLTIGDRGYRPDSMRMLWGVAFSGCGFKKVYDCPIRERPISRFVDAKDIIVSNNTSDLADCGRYTHRIVMRPSVLRRMQIAEVYRDISLSEPSFIPDAQEKAEAEAQGLRDTPTRQEDQPYTVYESYVELDVKGYEHKRKGEPTGLALPYKVSIEKDSRELLELRRNWEEEEETYEPRRCLVKFGFLPAMGFYDFGLLHLLGNGDNALTSAWRIALDAGMYANFPGTMHNEGAVRNFTNQNRIPPGGSVGIKGVPPSVPLKNVIEFLPYKDITGGLISLIQHLEQRMDRLAGTSELPVGEGRQDAPVGTTLALIEQATKILAAVFVGLHASQAEEFELLKERYRADPESFWRCMKKKGGFDWEEGIFLRALEDCEIVPAADPNTPSHMHRLMKWQAIVQLAIVQPQLFNLRALIRRVCQIVGIDDPDQYLATEEQLAAAQGQQGVPPDPNKLAALQQKAQQSALEHQGRMEEIAQKGQQQQLEHTARMAEAQADQQAQERDRQLAAQSQVVESADRAADRAGRTQVAQLREQTEREKIEAQRHQHQLDTFVKPHVDAAAKPPDNEPLI